MSYFFREQERVNYADSHLTDHYGTFMGQVVFIHMEEKMDLYIMDW